MERRDHYATLGVEITASSKEIERAYRRLAMRHHPDRNQGDEGAAAERFKALSEAMHVLGNPEHRRLYDAGLWRPGQAVHPDTEWRNSGVRFAMELAAAGYAFPVLVGALLAHGHDEALAQVEATRLVNERRARVARPKPDVDVGGRQTRRVLAAALLCVAGIAAAVAALVLLNSRDTSASGAPSLQVLEPSYSRSATFAHPALSRPVVIPHSWSAEAEQATTMGRTWRWRDPASTVEVSFTEIAQAPSPAAALPSCAAAVARDEWAGLAVAHQLRLDDSVSLVCRARGVLVEARTRRDVVYLLRAGGTSLRIAQQRSHESVEHPFWKELSGVATQ